MGLKATVLRLYQNQIISGYRALPRTSLASGPLKAGCEGNISTPHPLNSFLLLLSQRRETPNMAQLLEELTSLIAEREAKKFDTTVTKSLREMVQALEGV